ncbi:DUF5709 domain-containing protein [Nonomuraea gerenzanensis]|uniref:DUF5709 domain-containing protein n=1 Tax=Nonomuraea gerenzanensis TaxID=93944 RepID=A0A1M4E5S8_9ACTN|nr:DUF5709 domain-containing protein [Nonomuraea gerenzanensis]UBU16384.1 DUF5709 domain-containing protein [Nonomuraea gerenzanensis]SBO94205.1 hypothetical protein BN4615_P3721 [Nonomuraea gerenzanensis]
MDDYVPGLLPPEESLDDDELGEDGDGPGYLPGDRPIGSLAWGLTADEARTHEPFSQRLAHEVPDIAAEEFGDGIGDASDTDGELIDDQVGYLRAGRLVWATQEAGDPSSDLWAEDIGVDRAGASAEEAAIHIVSDDRFEV